MKYLRLSALPGDVVETVRRYPVETLFCLAEYVLLIACLEKQELMAMQPFLFFIILIFNELRPRRWASVAYWAMVVAAPLSLLLPWKEWISSISIQETLLYIALPLILLLISPEKTDRGFMRHAGSWLNSLILGLIVFAGYIAFALLQLSVETIFELRLKIEDLEIKELLFFAVVLYPFAVLSFHRRAVRTAQADKLFDLLVNYVLTPFVMFFTLIPYIYIAATLIRWKLVNGQVGDIFSAYLTVAVVAYGLNLLVCDRKSWCDRFYRHMSKLLIAPLILLFVSIGYRIYCYGFTELRYYLVLLGVDIAVAIVLLWRPARRALWLIALTTLALIVISTYIPGITAKDIERLSQSRRAETVVTPSHDSWNMNIQADLPTHSNRVAPSRDSWNMNISSSVNTLNVNGYSNIEILKYISVNRVDSVSYKLYDGSVPTGYAIPRSWFDSIAALRQQSNDTTIYCDSLVYRTDRYKIYFEDISILSAYDYNKVNLSGNAYILIK